MNPQELLQIFALANELKEGDLEIGGTVDDSIRRHARGQLSALSLGEISKATLVEDEVSEALTSSLDFKLAAEISTLTVNELRSILLSSRSEAWASRYREGLASHVIAAVVKVMTTEELSSVARSIFNPLTEGESVPLGSPQHFGSRLQPNSPGDDEEEILFSILEGLSYGCGDVILGINPAGDQLETIVRLEDLLRTVVERLRLPTCYCVLSDIVKQARARSHTAVDVGFQSLAGTSRALVGMVGLDVSGILDVARSFNGLYFETGQGSEVTNGAAAGVDMVTLEARTYGVARHIRRQTGKWMIVNDVAGFIGPEVFRTGEQLRRACLEDVVMAKLHGLTMGLDVCSTFHMGISPGALKGLTEQIVREAAPAYLMAVAGNTDPMLGYLTTSFREHPRLRRLTRSKVATPMHKRLAELGVMDARGTLSADAGKAESLYPIYMKAGGDTRSIESLREEAVRKIKALREERGYDLGYGHGDDYAAPSGAESRVETIHRNARHALYSVISTAVIRDTSPQHLKARSLASDREQYLSHPPSGERVIESDAHRLISLYNSRRPQAQIVISDGLNANAVNENLRALLPGLRRGLTEAGHHAGSRDIFVQNGRVRIGYHIGMLLGVDVIVHLIGERPGTGLNTLSAYLTYGRDEGGHLRWSPDLNHAFTTAVCGIHAQGKRPEEAVNEIVECVVRMFAEQRSGVALSLTQR
ncbi:MAG TPA: ethanolamine ammonia-lyase subunit EutB [Pyrinomonadaceae bacterium]|nr:ethanolamine ammonia-lyase subunit EutB [Pyrinomonadaceae bacterium]